MLPLDHNPELHLITNLIEQQPSNSQTLDLPLDFSQSVSKSTSPQANSTLSEQCLGRCKRDRKRFGSVCLNTLRSTSNTDGLTSRPSATDIIYNVSVRGESLVCLEIDGIQRLCLAQISSTLLKNFSYNEIHNRRVALGITCVQCSPAQLELLRDAGAMPASSRRCGTITRREAERLVKSFLDEPEHPKLPEGFAFDVTHHCGWGCQGQFVPSRYNSSRAKCVRCNLCQVYFSPNKFVFHSHSPQTTGILQKPEYRHPDAANFNAWRRHLFLFHPNPSIDLIYAWEDVKAMFNGGNRKRTLNSSNVSNSQSSSDERPNSGSGSAAEEFTYSRKRSYLKREATIVQTEENEKDSEILSTDESDRRGNDHILVRTTSSEKLSDQRASNLDGTFSVSGMLTHSPKREIQTLWKNSALCTIPNTRMHRDLFPLSQPLFPLVPNSWSVSALDESSEFYHNNLHNRTTQCTEITKRLTQGVPSVSVPETGHSSSSIRLPDVELNGDLTDVLCMHGNSKFSWNSLISTNCSPSDSLPIVLPQFTTNIDPQSNSFLHPWSLLFAQRFFQSACDNLSPRYPQLLDVNKYEKKFPCNESST